MNRNLREMLPQIEADWLLPAWLLTTITAAAIAEVITIGLAVREVYGLNTGWAVGGVIASAQAIGSMMWSRAGQHNAGRYVRHKSIGPKADRKRVEDRTRSEPALNAWGPGAVSILAGLISAWLGGAFYSADGVLTGLDAALAIAAPAGSIAAASLNGLFAYGETALADWRSERETGRPVSARPAASVQPPVAARSPSTKRPAKDQAKRSPSAERALDETSDGLAGHLLTIRQRLQAGRQSGERVNGTFKRTEVEAWCGVKKTQAVTVVNYGLDRGILQQGKGHKYSFTN